MGSIIDSHTHVWSQTCRLADVRRYTPQQACPINTLFHAAEAVNVGGLVLVQPSFLGTDNQYLLQQLEVYPDTVRGVVVLAPDTSEDEFKSMVKLGVVGVRFNLLGSSMDGEHLVNTYQHLIHLIKKYDCHLEIQAKESHWLTLLPPLLKQDINLVIDHFGRPQYPSCQGFKMILESLKTGHVWVKLSASYRFKADPYLLTQALLNIAPERLVWGSDYPWTQYEASRSYPNSLLMLKAWCDEPYWDAILTHNPTRLFKFDVEKVDS